MKENFKLPLKKKTVCQTGNIGPNKTFIETLISYFIVTTGSIRRSKTFTNRDETTIKIRKNPTQYYHRDFEGYKVKSTD